MALSTYRRSQDTPWHPEIALILSEPRNTAVRAPRFATAAPLHHPGSLRCPHSALDLSQNPSERPENARTHTLPWCVSFSLLAKLQAYLIQQESGLLCYLPFDAALTSHDDAMRMCLCPPRAQSSGWNNKARIRRQGGRECL